MLRTRVVSALIAIPIVVVAIFAGGGWFLAGALVVALIAGWEYAQMMQLGRYAPATFIILALIALLVVGSYFPAVQLLPLTLSLALLGSLAWQLFQHSEHPTADWALTVAGGLYIGWGIGHIVALRQLPAGLYWVWLALLCTWAADTFAYFTGRAIGKHKLWPRHSPKKTWEGLFGGIAASVVMALVLAAFAPELFWFTALAVGLLTPIAGLFGDLAISLMKRDVGVKDSSNLFPGHGGFLDRIDSVLFVSVVVYYVVSYLN
ncbi:MAG: Phosphatidate cytidylyltransferase [Anaerolineae bacterium]|nr:Phosphatidate cytidylyltransferase [Anaerolineae bacterium]